VAVFLNAHSYASSGAEEDTQESVAGAQKTTISDLPWEIMAEIFSYLDAKEMARADQVCKAWHEVLVAYAPALAISPFLFEPICVRETLDIPDAEVARALMFHVHKNGFAPLDNVFISPEYYPQNTRLLNHADLGGHPLALSAWHNALFGEAPQDIQALALIMSQILVGQNVSEDTLGRITPYVKKVGKRSRFKRFSGGEKQGDIEALTEAPCTIVVSAQDLLAHKSILEAILGTHPDHRVMLCFDSDAFIRDGRLTMSKAHIPANLRHLTLADPFGAVTSIGGYFLAYTNLVTFEARGMRNVQYIDDFFLFSCARLARCSLHGLTNHTRIKAAFLASCPELQDLHALGLSSLESIDGAFCRHCLKIKELHLHGFKMVESIGPNFMLGCLALMDVDPTPLTRVKQVGADFLKGAKLSPVNRLKVAQLLARPRQG